MTVIVAGIGSRNTPGDVLMAIEEISTDMAMDGHLLRSGGAAGADATFERGFRSLGRETPLDEPRCPAPEIFIPWWKFNKLQGSQYINCQTLPKYGLACEIASQFHPNWTACGRGAKALHARNVFIMLGKNLDTPVNKVYCWTPGGRVTGGTGQALRMAIHMNIPIINLGKRDRWTEDQYLNNYLMNSIDNFTLTSGQMEAFLNRWATG